MQDLDECSRMAAFARELGYRVVGITLPASLPKEQGNKVKEVFVKAGLSTVSRVDLHVGSRRELLAAIRRIRPDFELVAVLCGDQAIVRHATRDRRVDILYFDIKNRRSLAYLRMLRNAKPGVELNLCDLLNLQATAPSFSFMHELVERVISVGARVVVSSGARQVRDMRAPLDVVSLISEIVEDGREAMTAVSTNPMSLVQHRQSKSGSRPLEEGVKVLKRAR